MLSSFRSRSFLVSTILLIPLLVASCRSANRGPAPKPGELSLEATFADFIPGGRIYPNDLMGEKFVYEVRGAWLFDSHVVIWDSDGALTALDRKNLDAKWYYSRLKGSPDFPPQMGVVSLVVIADGILHEVDRWYGNQLHVYPLDFIPSAGAGASDSTAYVPSLAAAAGVNTFTTVNLATGIEGWRLSTRGSITHAPIVAGTSTRPMVYFASEDGGVFAYPADSAAVGAPELAWMAGAHGTIKAAPVLSGEMLLVGSTAGDLWSLDRVTGQVNWLKLSGFPIVDSAWASGDQVYFKNAQGFHALSRADGKDLWTFRQNANFICHRPDAVYVEIVNQGADKVTVVALDPSTGEALRTHAFPKGTIFLANQMDAIFYAVTLHGEVYAIDLPIE